MKLQKVAILGILVAAIAIATSLADATQTNKDEVIVLTAKNTASLNGPVSDESISDIIQKVQELNKKEKSVKGILAANIAALREPIYLFIHSPGGSVMSGMTLVEALKSSERPVHTITLFSASMGFQIVQSLGTRYILKSGTLMSHHASGAVQGEFGGKNNNQLRSRLSFLESTVQAMDLQTVLRTNGKQTLASYQEAYDHELWVHGDAAVVQGYADKVISVRCDESLAGVTHKREEVPSFFGTAEVFYDIPNCPLDSLPKNIKIKEATNTTDAVALKETVTKALLNRYTNLENNVLPLMF